ncbi:hypothetical protein DL762_001321 [Monosporascus cannonballus]|uniref:DUF6314 domain-containing protein n=1 Tax=Monosporascus cannonballus TaxID=155416 RepID=A0ABY0HH93_9PEZI|nr:hypothetical protein DL762_001321 [Monosporascus cannonballus]RYP01648.1 hypothetical protein DL763_000037 [Monosporascus cannonballus]
MTKSVCIIGAGPSGLVAAKTLLHDVAPGSFKVTVFDAQSRIGGLWPNRKDDGGGLVHPLMVANQSRHTVQFSDLAWHESDPQMPRAWQVGQYLERYLKRYVGGADLRLGHRVVDAELEDGGTWRVQTESSNGPETSLFDYLLVGTGFFGKPIWPDYVPREAEVPIIHSSKYRSLKSLLGNQKGRGGKILVIGGQMSGIEIAGTIATHLSSAVNSPGEKEIEEPENSVLGTDQFEFSEATKVEGSLMDEPPFLAMSDQYMDFVRSGLITITKGKLASLSGRTATLAGNNEEITDIAAVVLATGFDPSPSISFLSACVLGTLSHSPSNPNLPLALAFHGTHHPSLPTLGFVGFYRSPYWGVMEMQARFLAQLWTTPTPSTALRHALEADDSIRRTLALRSDPRASQFPMGDYAFLMQEFARALGMTASPPLETPPLANGRAMDILTPARYCQAGGDGRRGAEATRSLAQTQETAVAALGGVRFVARAVFRSLLGEWSLEREIVSRLPSHPSGRFVGAARFLLRAGTVDGRRGTDPDADLGLEYLYVEDGEFSASNGMRFRATRRYVYRYDEARDRLSVWFARPDDPRRADYLFHELDFMAPSSEAAARAGEGHEGAVGLQKETAKELETEGGRAGEGAEEGGQRGWRARASHPCVEDLYDVRYEFAFRAVNLRDWRIAYTVKGPKKDYTIDGVYKRP